MHEDELDDELDWHPCPKCLGQVEPVDDGGFFAMTCSLCGFVAERLRIPTAERPEGSGLPNFDGF